MNASIALSITDHAAVIERMVDIERKARAAVPDGWELPEDLAPSMAPVALDLLGVPAHGSDGTDRGAIIFNYWLDLIDGRTSVADFVDAVDELMELPA